MSRRTERKTRTAPARRRAARREPTLDERLEQTLDLVLPPIRRQIDGLHATERPLDAEVAASDLLSTWSPSAPWDREAYEVLGRAVIRRLASRPDADALALLLAIAALGQSPFESAARQGAEHLRKRVPEPSWSRSLGSAEFVSGWISTDRLEDQSLVVSTFGHPGRDPHTFVAIVDANFGGLIRSLDLTLEEAPIRAEWTMRSGMPIGELDPQDAADVLGRGIAQFDGYLDPPTDESGRVLMPLLKSRMRALPAPRPVELAEVSEEEREALLENFVASEEARGLRRVDGEPAALIASSFIEFACDYGAGDPLRWSPIAIEMLLLDWRPRKAILSDGEADAVPRVLQRFIRYCARRKGLEPEDVAENLSAVRKYTAEYRERMRDDAAAGPAKQLFLEMRAAGVDFEDPAAVQVFIDRRNAETRLDRS